MVRGLIDSKFAFYASAGRRFYAVFEGNANNYICVVSVVRTMDRP